ncbi:MAG: biotin--[acetyl-CoA-carboxylase] ligase, partial [Clostridia bacterium]|nr:biotin--[acetyl-CoA-carboxylase] ligase [Clostridia bacterium]
FRVIPLIKWVNDIYIDEKKVCGILTEGVFDPEGGGFRYAVLGIGVNLSFPKGGFPEDIKDTAGSVCESVSAEQKKRFIDRLLFEFYDIYENGREYMREYKARSNVLGKKIEYIKDGKTLVGTATDITDDGALTVKDEHGISYLRSGEVKICIDSIIKKGDFQ